MEKKEWKTETLLETKIGNGQAWRLQRSTSPTGEDFIGVRRFTVRGEEYLPDRNGLTFKMSDTTSFKAVIELLKEMKSEMVEWNFGD